MEQVRVSVIIPAYNSHRTLVESVEGIYRQTAYVQVMDIIIVDSSDNPDALEQINELKKREKVRVFTSGVRVMPAIQRNLGAAHSQADLLCFLDSDAYPAENWIERAIEVYRSGIKVGGGSYKLPPFQEKTKIAIAQYYLQFNEYLDAGKNKIKKLVPSCNLFCDRKLFLEVGGFPEIRASEDTLFGLKVSQTSTMYFIPGMPVYHIFREEKDSYYRNQEVLGKYIFIYRKMVYNSFYYRGVMPYLFYPFFAFFKIMRILMRVRMAGRKHFIRLLPAMGLFMRGMKYWRKGFLQGVKDYDREVAIFRKENQVEMPRVVVAPDPVAQTQN